MNKFSIFRVNESKEDATNSIESKFLSAFSKIKVIFETENVNLNKYLLNIDFHVRTLKFSFSKNDFSFAFNSSHNFGAQMFITFDSWFFDCVFFSSFPHENSQLLKFICFFWGCQSNTTTMPIWENYQLNSPEWFQVSISNFRIESFSFNQISSNL